MLGGAIPVFAALSVDGAGGVGVVQKLQQGDPERAGPYRLVGRLGSGGMGRVFLGQSAGGRLVAVKVIREDLATDPEFRVRFGREVAAARRVDGLFTAPVVDADVDGPMPWLATTYVAGPSLADAVSENGPLSPESVLSLAAGLAEGLGAIHSAGLVHRDLKPSNVLLADDGPRVIDFGISRATEASALTRSGMVLGTPGFMSPEQAEGDNVGPASDVFSLGAVLVFAATGMSPFGTGAITALLYRVVHSPPRLDGVPPQVRPIAERCLAKDPRERPAPAEILAEVGDIGLVREQTERRRAAREQAEREQAEREQAERERAEREEAERRRAAREQAERKRAEQEQAERRRAAREQAEREDAERKRAEREQAERRRAAREQAEREDAERKRVELRRASRSRVIAVLVLAILTGVGIFIYHEVSRPPGVPLQLVGTFSDPKGGNIGFRSVAFSPNGEIVAVGETYGREIYLWNAANGQLDTTITASQDGTAWDPNMGVSALAFSPDGKTLAIGTGEDNGGGGNAYLVDTATDLRTATLADPNYPSAGILGISFSPNGKTIAMSDWGDNIFLWDSTTRKIIRRIPLPQDSSLLLGDGRFAYSPDGKTLATTGARDVILRDVATGRTIATLTSSSANECPWLGYSPNGKTIAITDGNGKIHLWNTATRQATFTLTSPNSNGCGFATYSPDGTTIAFADFSGEAYLWNTATGKLTARLTEPDNGNIFEMAYSPDGSELATITSSGHVYLWSTKHTTA